MIERTMREFRAAGMRPSLAHIEDVAAFVRWCEAEGIEPAESRADYAVRLAQSRATLPGPRGRNDRCWCQSGRKYKRCCGAVRPAEDA